MRGPFDVASALAQAARDLREPQDLQVTLDTIVQVAQESIPGVDHVGIMLAHRGGRIETIAASGPVVEQLDRLQVELGEGPCLHAIDVASVVRVEHAEHETRWPRFMPAAVQLGLRSQLGVFLHADEQTLGALNLYSFSSGTVSPETEQMADLFAVHVGLVLGYARRIENLSAALATRKVIGLALGMLMQRLGIDEDAAFAYLTRMSATSETKLRDVAAAIVDEHQRRIDGTEPSAV